MVKLLLGEKVNGVKRYHNNLCNEIDQLCFQWIGASNPQFIQMFNDARPKAFTSIHSLVKVEEDLKRIAEKFRNTDNQDVTMEEGAMCGPLSSEKEDFDGEKLARDIVGEISGEYDIRRAWNGIDPSTGEKLSTLDRVFAGGMAVAGLTPFGKIAKVGKGVKKTAKATEAVNKAKKVPVEKVNGVNGAEKYNTDTMKHIYHGEINKRGKAVGYHHESMMCGKIIPGTESVPDKNGIYRAKVEIDGVEKVAKSSFFPKEWNRVDVLKGIDEAYQNKIQVGSYKYKGVTSSGIKIEMYLNTDGSIATAYPLYKK
ncbi:WXG100 family type VII secretion target [Bacillus cereus]|uniref:WXG100 family type VII secretion target n=1 Tax=Bacillus cereus TaxID=1396 RepID=UPI0020D26C2F|nr:WXG100 family type VII secretion target [Bacillus cereus]